MAIETDDERQMTRLKPEIASATGLQIVNKAPWDQAVKDGGRDKLGVGTITLAYEWGRKMQEQLDAGRSLKDVAWDCFCRADDIVGGATGGMAKSATTLLGETWQHGGELVTWHNEQAARPGTAQSMVGPIETNAPEPKPAKKPPQSPRL